MDELSEEIRDMKDDANCQRTIEKQKKTSVETRDEKVQRLPRKATMRVR